jgi:opacity protein-like surface antigen
MNRIIRTLLIGTVLAVGGGAVALAADAPNPVVGTWTLNLAKSKFSPGPAPKSQTRTYAQTAQGTALTFNGVAADGSAVSGQSTFKYDGKDYPITGSPDFDTLSLKRINGSTVKSTQKKAGKVVGTTTRTISAHGKVLTLLSKGTDAKGMSYDNVLVFDKQ